MDSWVVEGETARQFIYAGQSMNPTLRAGHLLCVRPDVDSIVPGDIVVFAHPVGRYVVHRVVSVSNGEVITRGDHNRHNDLLPVLRSQLVGRLHLIDDGKLLRRVVGGRAGLWAARIRWGRQQVTDRVRRMFGETYRAVRKSIVVRTVLASCLSRHLQTVCVETANGLLVKTVYRDRTVARWWPELDRFECRKPFDLFVPRPGVLDQLDRPYKAQGR